MAAEPRERIDCAMSRETACVLNSRKSSLVIQVAYPATLVCKIKLLSTLPLYHRDADRLADLLRVEMDLGPDAGVLVPDTSRDDRIEYALGSQSLYLTWVKVRTKDGSSLDEVIQTAHSRRNRRAQVIAVPVFCDR